MLPLALLVALDPIRLGLTLLVVSGPRPVQNLVAYWVGAMLMSVPSMLVLMMVLHTTPRFTSFAHDLAASSTVRHIQIGIGVFSLSIAALMTVRLLARQRAHLRAQGSTTSTTVLDSDAPAAISRLLGRAQDAATGGGSVFRRLLGRAYNAWENGSLWFALVIGLGSGPPPLASIFVLTTIMASGATIGMQVCAAVAWVVGVLAVVEIMLVSHLVTPAKSQAVLRLLHDWALAYRRQILLAMLAVVGVSLVAQGTGSI
jgi:Sap, sulfolipid-1-addressing protein